MKQKCGFTIIEFIVTVLIIGIIAGVGAPLIAEIADGWLLQTRRKEMSESARIAMERMIRETRRIANTTSVITANSGTLQFIDIDNHDITFDVLTNTLRRTADGTAVDLADNIDSLSFIYYNASGATITTPLVSPDTTNIKRIEITVTFSLGGTQLSVQSQAAPRRLP